MKILLTFFLAVAGFVRGQPDIIRNTFEKYNGQKGFVLVTLTGDMLRLASEMQEIKLDTVLKSQLDEIKILVYQDTLDQSKVNLYAETYDRVDKSLFKEMMTVVEEGNNISLLANEKNGTIMEFILIAGGSKENAIIYGSGNILLDEAMKVIGSYFQDKAMGFMKKGD